MTETDRRSDSSPSPCGRGQGGGGDREVPGTARSTPPPIPLPQGEGEESLTRAHHLRAAAESLRQAGLDSPRLEARLLLAHVLGLTPEALLRGQAAPVPPGAGQRYARLLARRLRHEPLAYLTGHRAFWTLDLAVSPATLIPRPDSETLVEAARAAFAGRPGPRRILDLGTGTGCLLLAALSEFPAAFGIGVDRNPAAARLAASNATRNGIGSRAAFLCADWAAPLAAPFDLILCNPPYIPTSEISELMPDVAEYEPVAALDGGADGLQAYRSIIPALRQHLVSNGVAVFELGIGQARDVAKIAERAGLRAETRLDLAGIPRAAVLCSTLP